MCLKKLNVSGAFLLFGGGKKHGLPKTRFVPPPKFLADISAPKKKKFSPPPQIPQFAADTFPAPRPLPLLEEPPPPPGNFYKNQTPPPPPGTLDSPIPLPEQKKNKSETSTKN